VSEHDDFEFRDWDRRLAPELKRNRLPPLVPRLRTGAGRGAAAAPGASPAVGHQRAPLRGRIMALLFWALALWCSYALAQVAWVLFR
jgi:hypothetical protein